jgi:hypothetical protein
MYHVIEFTVSLWVDLAVAPKQPLARLLLLRGTRVAAQIRPSILESNRGPVEVADLFFADGTVTRQIPYACFSFVD